MQPGDIAKFSYFDNWDEPVSQATFIAMEFKMSEERAKKVINQSCRILEIVNSGTHVIAGYLDGSNELLPISTLKKIG